MDSIKNTLKSATGKDPQSQSQFEKGMFELSHNVKDIFTSSIEFITIFLGL